MSQTDGKIITAIAESNELDIFHTELVKDVIDFKWKQYAQKSHLIGAFFHTIYVCFMMYYINNVYMIPHAKDKDLNYISNSPPNMVGLAGMQVGMFYALWHDCF